MKFALIAMSYEDGAEVTSTHDTQTAPMEDGAGYAYLDSFDVIPAEDDDVSTGSDGPPADEELGPLSMNLGSYSCKFVSNIPATSDNNDPSNPRTYFDLGLRHFFAYHHEEAYKCFLACIALAPDCAFAHGMVALCHGPNYNFKGEAYYESTNHAEEEANVLREVGENGSEEDIAIMRRLYPSQQVASRHALLAIQKVQELKRRHRGFNKNSRSVKLGRKRRSCPAEENDDQVSAANSAMTPTSQPISDIETQILSAIRTLTMYPGIHPELAEKTVGRPYSDALRKVHQRFPQDAEVSYFFAESLMVLNAWNLYEYPTGRPLSRDIGEIQVVLEEALVLHPDHAGICHLYVHLCEMSSHPEKALPACRALRTCFPDAGHLIHMPTHIDVLVGDYESCVQYNFSAIIADEKIMKISPDTAGTESFYFGYIVHNFHMLVYGAILGGMEGIGMEMAHKLNGYLNEDLFIQNPDLTAYLESYAALDIHIMVRFGRWEEILNMPFPKYPLLMLFRSAALHFARGLALANLGHVQEATKEANLFDDLRLHSSAGMRILHNNTVANLLAVDAPMLRGEIAYFSGNYDEAFSLLRRAVALQDGLNYDEPWGKMQPIRHALGGLLCKQGHFIEAEQVFRVDLRFHPANPWSLVGLIACLNGRLKVCEKKSCCHKKFEPAAPLVGEDRDAAIFEVKKLESLLEKKKKAMWVDFDVSVPCLCCKNNH
mmetsp:Transcript_5397/g.11551  ORF Transcript_5397/g.11551 Transcript_5397/m.11551 type:complete len:716 (+) Transcript_5397:202-2349(+)|eukprot:CAMPEP_0171349078 /NCGR_PEP_ID=MMETSP0878-20121228/32741_1 /TAXON_ID=67004 /ORGANISM="Thalassiosira weissflogii, Strain CCMP1336" /LENGTH=715 /DNA_ID=CAMNT_0011853619 /DNA_START=174 /DNA_END=2321 /DNA_ORIENTATION=+